MVESKTLLEDTTYLPQVPDEYLIVEYDGLGGCLDVAECGHLKLHPAHVVGVAPHLHHIQQYS